MGEKIKIYCENGALTKQIKKLRSNTDIELIGYPFEQVTKKTTRSEKPSGLKWDESITTWDDTTAPYDQTGTSEKFDEIETIIGKTHTKDIQHVDTAYKEGCRIFITPDKGDIVSKKNQLEKVTNIKFFHSSEIGEIMKAIKQQS